MINKLLLLLRSTMFYMVLMLPAHAESLSQQIDQLLNISYKEKSITPNNIVSDSVFLRRAFISVIGRIPTLEESEEFYQYSSSTKRHKLIDKLIDSRGYSGKMFLFYADLLRLKTNSDQHGMAFHKYLYDSTLENKPYDKLVKELLTAEGHVADNVAVGYYLRDRGMLLDNMSNTFQVFLGTQIGCAQCHDDPFSDTTQLDFYKLAAFSGRMTYRTNPEIIEAMQTDLAKVRRKGSSKNKKAQNKKESRSLLNVFKYYKRNTIGYDSSKGLKLPDDYQYSDGKPGQIVKPAVTFGTKPRISSRSNHKEVFAQWLTSPSNPLFTKVLANRLWNDIFGYPLADTLTNWTSKTKISNEKILNLISMEIINNQYNVKAVMKELYKTELFQRAAATQLPAPSSTFDFHAPTLRRLSAEQLHDSLLTIESGNIDHVKNKGVDTVWGKFKELSDSVKKLEIKELLILGEQVALADRSIKSVKRKTLILKQAISKARKDNDDKLASRLSKELKELKNNKNSQKNNMDAMQNIGEGKTSDLVKFAMQRNLRAKAKDNSRSYEQPQPFYASSFIRKFGGSDGEISNSAHDKASITQALTLLNGSQIHHLSNKKSELQSELRKVSSADEKLRIIFLTLYSRYPTKAEITNYSEYTQSSENLTILIKAMLNSKPFLFIQ